MDIDLTAATEAAEAWQDRACPHDDYIDCQCAEPGIDELIMAALPHIREALALQIENQLPEMGRNITISAHRGGLADGMTRAARIVRGQA